MKLITSDKAIAWINGRWGHPSRLGLPLRDSGLQLADGLFETVLILGGKPCLLADHLQRWRNSAQLLGMALPPDEKMLLPLIYEAIERSGLIDANASLRLNWSRGNTRLCNIDTSQKFADPASHRFWLELNHHVPQFTLVTAIISRHERRNANSLLSRCKTFAYGQAIQARREARQTGAEEALLLSTTGELCCGTTANLMIQRHKQWLTPRLASGCLPGIMRARALKLGLAQEAELKPLTKEQDRWFLINSLGCRCICSVNSQSLKVSANMETLWSQLCLS